MITSRSEAMATGAKTYFTGKPCKHGHVADRATSNSTCVTCHLIKAKAAYARNSAAARKRRMDRYNLNVENERESMRRYYRSNIDRQQESRKIRYWENPENCRAKSNQWRRDNQDKRRSSHAKRRAAKQERLPVWFGELDQFVMQEAAALAAERAEQTGFEWHIDHMIPLQARKASGLHCADNIQVIPARINIRKRNRLILTEPLQWLEKTISAT